MAGLIALVVTGPGEATGTGDGAAASGGGGLDSSARDGIAALNGAAKSTAPTSRAAREVATFLTGPPRAEIARQKNECRAGEVVALSERSDNGLVAVMLRSKRVGDRLDSAAGTSLTVRQIQFQGKCVGLNGGRPVVGIKVAAHLADEHDVLLL
jgi:hypothetical protein